MNKKQLALLFICNLTPLAVGNARAALMPIFYAKLGAEENIIGILLAAQFIALAAGTMLGGPLSGWFGSEKRLLFVSGIGSLPPGIAMGYLTNFWLLGAMIVIIGFLSGVTFSLVNVVAGRNAKETERGKIFGIIGLTLGSGALIGGLIGGPIVDRWGFTTLFSLTALIMLAQSAAALFLEDGVPKQPSHSSGKQGLPLRKLGIAFFLLFFASNLTYVTPYVGFLVRPLVMENMGFSATAIASPIAVSGALSIPLTLLVGWLSDRFGRKFLLAACYLANTGGMLLLMIAVPLWHFQLSAALLLGVNAGLAVGAAYVTDIVPKAYLGTALSLFSATAWIGAIVGFPASGYAVQLVGAPTTLLISAFLPLGAIVLLLFVENANSKTTIIA